MLRNLSLASTENLPIVSEAEKLAVARWTAGKSPHTARQYAATLRQFLAAAKAESIAEACATAEVAEKAIVAFEVGMALAGASPATIQSRMSGLRVLLQHCARRKVCPPCDWCIAPTSARGKPPVVIPTEKQCLAAIELEPNPEVQLLMRLLYGTGMRISEALGLKYEHFLREDNGRLVVYLVGKGSKSALVEVCPAAEVEAPLLQALASELRKRGEACEWSGWVVKKPVQSISSAFVALRKAWKRAGVEKLLDVTGQVAGRPGTHTWRHCHITHVQERGATREQAQLQARHTRGETTEKYSQYAPENPGRLLGRSD